MKLWLDDERAPTEWLPDIRWFRGRDDLGEWIWVRTSAEAIAALEAGGIDEVSLDHDLGPAEEVGDGYDVLTWIEERVAFDDSYEPPVIHIHTSNLGARDRMESAVQGIENLLARRKRPE